MLKRLIGIFAVLAMAAMGTMAQAARVSPMIVDLTPSGRGTIARVTLTNPDARTFPVEVQMMRGEISEEGELELTPADDQFLVFPAQAVVPATSQQVFRVQYVGTPELSQSEIYYMVIRQIPVELSAAENQVQVIVNFNVLVNVVPDGATPNPVVESVRPAVRNDVAGIEVRLGNTGSRYFHAGAARWQITGTGADGQPFSQTIEPSDVIRSVGVGVVAPNHHRLFFVPTARPLSDAPITVSLTAPSTTATPNPGI
jgi:fimbrial chaperone protein